jgi:transposase
LIKWLWVSVRKDRWVRERTVISDEAWAVIEPLLPRAVGRSRPWLDHRMVIEGVAWRFRTGAPWRDLPPQFGPWNTVFKRFDRWAKDGTWAAILTAVQARAEELGELDWVVSIDSTITRVHQHGATAARPAAASAGAGTEGTGGAVELQDSRTGA